MSLFDAAERPELIEVHRATTVRNGHGEEIETFALLYRAYASVQNGTGGERRQAAQEGGSKASTFGIPYSAIAATTKLRDQLHYRGVVWDITDATVEPRNSGIVIAAVRAQ